MISEKYCQRESIQSLFIETVSIKKMLLQRLFEDVVDTLVKGCLKTLLTL